MKALSRCKRVLPCCLLATVLAACHPLDQLLEPETSTKPIAADPEEQFVQPPLLSLDSTFADLADFLEWLYLQPVQNLQPLYEELSKRSAGDRTPVDDLSLALLLSVSDTSFQNDRRSLELVETVEAEVQDDSDLHSFARVQRVHMEFRRKLNQRWQHRLSEERELRTVLEQQLEELKSLEMNFDRRDELRR